MLPSFAHWSSITGFPLARLLSLNKYFPNTVCMQLEDKVENHAESFLHTHHVNHGELYQSTLTHLSIKVQMLFDTYKNCLCTLHFFFS